MPIFHLRQEHFDLMKRIHVQWQDCEYGAPEVDPKRPYGNSGRHSILMDMGEALGIPPEKIYNEAKDEIIPAMQEYLEVLHRELEHAIEIVLRTNSFQPGIYEAPAYTNKWVFTAPPIPLMKEV